MAERCEDLPDECWELIFNRLDHHSQFEALSLVCRRFLSITDRLRTCLTILYPTIHVHGTLSKLFNRFHRVKTIDLSRFHGEIDRVVLEIAGSGLNLEALDVSGSHCLAMEGLNRLGLNMKSLKVFNCAGLWRFCDSELLAIANSMPWVEELDISYPRNVFDLHREFENLSPDKANITDEGIRVLSSKLRGLRKINISGNEFLTDRSIDALCSNCVLLEEIVVQDCPLITHHSIGSLIRNSPNLGSVKVNGLRLFGSSVDLPVSGSFGYARALSCIVMHNSFVSDEFLSMLVKSDIPLKRFSLDGCFGFTFSGLSLLLQTYQYLEYFSLVGVDFLTDDHMSHLSNYLSTSIAVKLGFCSGLTHLTFAVLVKNCPLLEDIDMGRTNLGVGECNVDAVENPRIRSLKLVKNVNLTNECLGKLASMCPGLQLLDVSYCLGIDEEGILSFLRSGSKIRQLQINGCWGIKNIGTSFELPELEVLQAAKSGINDKALATIGARCRMLQNLNLKGCLGVTAGGLKEILTNCRRLREINLTSCVNVSMEDLVRLVFSRPSLRKVVPPNVSFATENQGKIFLRHGCLLGV
ncbi:F-box/LRR-repeat protein 3 [Diospyros lotus]|uniref:F-box/LRR-repeat protein 3 n=1 Tax=Diospyros lotus TaxID=55363 RepID=UPI00225707B1|nr:F-box/LRR-repeat protein 3 [Diospyros lotus]